MKNSTDPSTHQAAERQIIEHVQRLLEDPRLMIDTTDGRRAVSSHIKQVSRADRGIELKRAMSELNLPDRDLQNRMPTGEQLDVTLVRKRWWFFTKPVGRLKVVCVSPTRELLSGGAVDPMTGEELARLLRETPPPLTPVPNTVVVVSTSGFTMDAREKIDRTAQQTLILAEPNDAGGWTIHGPSETKALNDLLDPEAETGKRQRVRDAIGQMQMDLMGGGIAADKLSARTQVPLQIVEAELKSYAKASGLVAKRLDGRVVLYREGSAPLPAPAVSGSGSSAAAGGSDMPIIDRIKALFSGKGENEKKVAFLSERRAALSQQRDRAYDEIATLEAKDGELRKEFADARTPHTKKRITSQLLQLRKDIERRHQMLNVFNQQINVVSTHLHNLELLKQGDSAKLPDSEEIASDAAAAEEMLAQLQADSEVADSVSTIATLGMSSEEQALYEELEREAKGDAAGTPDKIDLAHAEEPEAPAPQKTQATQSRQPTAQRQRGQAEPG